MYSNILTFVLWKFIFAHYLYIHLKILFRVMSLKLGRYIYLQLSRSEERIRARNVHAHVGRMYILYEEIKKNLGCTNKKLWSHEKLLKLNDFFFHRWLQTFPFSKTIFHRYNKLIHKHFAKFYLYRLRNAGCSAFDDWNFVLSIIEYIHKMTAD